MSEQTTEQVNDGLERDLGPGAREAVDGDMSKSAAPEVDEELQMQTLTIEEQRKAEQDAENAGAAAQGAPAQTPRAPRTAQTPAQQPPADTQKEVSGG